MKNMHVSCHCIIVLCQEKFKIQDVDNYVERVDNFVDMSEKGWDKTRKIAKKQEVVINMRAWKQGVQEKAVEKVIHALWKGNEQKNKRRK
ncbi:hypothetical protein AXF09_04480 [Ruminococcus sp. DSM 100440]|nr:hypothetical protein AXF09_04480 [Ruminococcus sp. DSM 100440]